MDRDSAIASMMIHLHMMEEDIQHLHEASRGWNKSSKGHQLLRVVDRDYRSLRARVHALAGEVGHMDAIHRLFTGATGTGPKAKPKMAAPPPLSEELSEEAPPEHEEPENLEQAPEPQPRRSTAPLGSLPTSDTEHEKLEDPPEKPDTESTPSQEARRKLDSMATGLPKHILDQLKKEGFE